MAVPPLGTKSSKSMHDLWKHNSMKDSRGRVSSNLPSLDSFEF